MIDGLVERSDYQQLQWFIDLLGFRFTIDQQANLHSREIELQVWNERDILQVLWLPTDSLKDLLI